MITIKYTFTYPPEKSKLYARKKAVAARNEAIGLLYEVGLASKESLTRKVKG